MSRGCRFWLFWHHSYEVTLRQLLIQQIKYCFIILQYSLFLWISRVVAITAIGLFSWKAWLSISFWIPVSRCIPWGTGWVTKWWCAFPVAFGTSCKKMSKECWDQGQIKSGRPHLQDYLHMHTDYRLTDEHLRLVMVFVVLYCKSRAPNINRCTSEIWAWPLTLTLNLNQGNSDVKTGSFCICLGPWPTNPAKSRSTPCQLLRSKVKGSAVRVLTDWWTDGWTDEWTLPTL